MRSWLPGRTWADIRFQALPALTFQLLLQLSAFAVGGPLLTWVGRHLVLAAGEPTVSNFDIAGFLFSPMGILSVLIIAALAGDALLAELAGQRAVRTLLRDRIKALANMRWVNKEQVPSDPRTAPAPPATYGYEQIWLSVRTLSPVSDVQRALQARALDVLDQLGQTRWLLTAQSSEGISMPMLVVVVVWLAVIAGCSAAFAPRNRTMLVVGLLCAMSVSATIFLLMELYDPFSGAMRMSNAPLQSALNVLSQP